MVCKKQLCDWFSNLSAHKRIEYICALMQLFHPLELRFFGSVLEDLGKKNFLSLRDAETQANSVTNLGKLNDLSQILISLTLLHSSNSRCSNVLYDVLQSYLQRCFNRILSKEPEAFTDLMTMLTIAVNHPAFSYEQRQSLSEFYSRAYDYSNKIEEEIDLDLTVENNQNRKTDNARSPLKPANVFPKVYIRGLEVKENKKHPDNKIEIKVTWSDDTVENIFKTPKQLYDFHTKLANFFPASGDHEKRIPYLRVNNFREDKVDRHVFYTYIRKLNNLSRHILDCDHVVEFFKGDHPAKLVKNLSPKSTYCPSSSPSNLSGEEEDAIPPFPLTSLTFLNSQLPVCSNVGKEMNIPVTALPPNRQFIGPTVLTARTESPSQSPPSSSTESPHNSPSASPLSQTSEMTSDTQPLFSLDENPDQLSNYTVKQLTCMKDEDLVKTDLPRDAQKKLRNRITEHFGNDKPNGLVEPQFTVANIIPLVPPPVGRYPAHFTHPPPLHNFIHHFQNMPNSRDNSPSNSEPSSPPTSPHLNQASNLVKSSSNMGSQDKIHRDDKEFSQTGSLPRTGVKHSQGGGSVKYPVHNIKPDGLLPQPTIIPMNVPESSHDLQGLLNQNGYQSDNPPAMSPAVRPEMLNIQVRPYSGKQPHPNMGYSQQKLVMMPAEKQGNAMAPSMVYPMPTSVFSSMMDNQTRPFMNQPGILGHPPNLGSSRPGFTSVSNATTMTISGGPRTSLTPTPPMAGNTGTKSPNNSASNLVNSSSDPNQPNHEQTNSPSPLQMNNPANTTVPCSAGPVAHNHQPCSACGSPRPPNWPIPGLLPTSNGYMQTIPSIPHPYQAHMHPQTFPNGMNPELFFNSMPVPLFYNHPMPPFLYGNNMYPGVANNVPKKTFCHNCGSSSHKGADCKESTMESMSGHYHLNYKMKSDSD
ncbi:zinc finger CCHC domain-containing protein 2 [Patella vulgata]|uniref:zinc finger CCHC domain-containing protein 2 n=1 Tax=Patella vulgata TaxID=6465 RepID=UPI0021801B2D|nr:zinc finger CCHC domain-containing protein 2 [Patella vulgata]